MKALHIVCGNLYGGVESLLVTLARCQQLHPRLEMAFALTTDGRLRRELEEVGSEVHMLGHVRLRNLLSLRRARANLAELLARGRFGAAICHSAWPEVVFGREARRAGVPLVYWLHCATSGDHWLERLAKRVPPDLVIAVSRDAAESCRASLYPGVRTEVLYSPMLDTAKVDRAASRKRIRAELGTPEGRVVILQVSRMEAWKGQEDHLEALRLMQDVPDWECWLVGGLQRPHERDLLVKLERDAVALGIRERVRFLGERSDVPHLMAAADVFCQPNRQTEGFSMVFREALISGLPLVTTDVGSARELIDDRSGILVPPGDRPALVRALERLLRDKMERARLGAAGAERVWALCDPKEQTARLESLLGGVFEGAPAA